MSATNIEFSGFSLQDDNFHTKDIIYRNFPARTIDVEPYSRRDGFRFVNSYYNNKIITIKGTLTRDTEANLRTTISSMKEALNAEEANLDIDDGGTTMRYVCTVESIDVPEEHYHITRIPYSISFRCQPFGKTTSSTSVTNSITNSPFADTINPTGSIGPRPTLKWTCNGVPSAAVTQISFANSTTSDTITVGSLTLDADGDYLEIDCENMTVNVSYDGGAESEVDFTGVFPDFDAGSNSYTVTITCAGSYNLSEVITYYPTYL